jgi:hypothetical protein
MFKTLTPTGPEAHGPQPRARARPGGPGGPDEGALHGAASARAVRQRAVQERAGGHRIGVTGRGLQVAITLHFGRSKF